MATRQTTQSKNISTARKKSAPAKKSTPTQRAATAKSGSTVARPKTAAKRSADKGGTGKGGQGKSSDALALLMADHAQVKKMYKQYQKLADQHAPAGEREALAMDICRALTLHAQVEESIFYPAARSAMKEEDQDLLDHADVEHASAKDLIAQIMSMQPDESHYDAKVCVLCEYVEHHVKEEEEEMFPKVRKAKLDLPGLGQQIQQEKERLSESDDPVGTPVSESLNGGHRASSGKTTSRERAAPAN